ncbi:strictosidine synthase family protein [Candidatus Rhodobacter oscarellae]|uniref:Strictosidine synthase family protein n=1 Tax=Candidatus Rhodobacter oscarellae TaxID=1675527 RepID=A0A0J9E6S7_9RHOB|nr:SMP-30/gluconolactonase/LRE family protein [Candidatus Rhodobacter lobularis]KMW58397.1 strictosidine synthase family protein [Candidatus Rhodobacter lobularis]
MRGVILLSLILAGLYLAFWPVPVAPVAYAPPKAPGLTGAFAPSDALGGATRLRLPEGAAGPEDIAVLNGALYTADVTGGLFRLEGDALTKVAQLGGRPLGLDEGPDGALYIADSFHGLMRWTPDGGAERLVEEIDGAPVIYANQLDVARDGTVYFSASSQKFDPETMGGTLLTSVMTIWEQSQTGSVARWHPERGAEIITDGFVFTNGVALSPGEDFLLIAETGRARLHRLWLTGDQAGQREIFMENLPGYPDNIEPVGDGTYWMAFASPRVSAEALMPYPFLRKMIWRLGPMVRPAPIPHGIVVHFDGEGNILNVLQNSSGSLGITTGARVVGDDLYISLLEGPVLARLPLAEIK